MMSASQRGQRHFCPACCGGTFTLPPHCGQENRMDERGWLLTEENAFASLGTYIIHSDRRPRSMSNSSCLSV
jgi:hypothetical protein